MANSKIYTKTGDKGQTSLVGGQRISKSDERIDLYGMIDELNSFIGVAISKRPETSSDNFNILDTIQTQLFVIGSNIACLKSERAKFKLKDIQSNDIETFENLIDNVDKTLDKLQNFIMPTGTEFASSLHVCRTISRRVERAAYSFSVDNQGEISQEYLQYFNRLSDLFFVLARLANKEAGIEDILWS